MKFQKGIQDFAANYDYFIFDLWGVIHDGIHAYEGAVAAVSLLHKQGKKICFLSNAPRRASKVVDILEKFGITKNMYEFIITSGEATFYNLQKNQSNNFASFGKNYFYIGPKKDIDLLQNLSYQKTDNVAMANFAIVTGFDDETSILQEKLPQLIAAKKYNLPLICVNPDLIVVRKNGTEMLCAGVLAAEYEKMGGKVFYYGKPFPAVYEMTASFFNNPSKNKIIAIGDGIETDIQGAVNFGIDSVLVTGGILCNKLGVRYGEEADHSKVEAICQSYKIFPKYIIPNL